ncbi:MAG: PepSY domain-containing protein [Planctomycetota bacterium]
MKLFRFLWSAHKWTGIILATMLLVTSVTGVLLIVKKDFAWLQPPTQRGAEGGLEDFLPLGRILEAAFAAGHPDLRTLADVDRVDFRPAQRVHKVTSRRGHTEIQVDAITGAILSVDWRASDLIEDIHDGSFFGSAFHGFGMPLVAVGLGFLVVTGIYLWLAPLLRRRRRRATSTG